jgi:glycosyltransferase involved in cell wall biosynthesis
LDKITSIIITYKRYANIKKIVDSLKAQTIPTDIIIWDNAGEIDEISGATVIRSSKNFVCRPRFLLCGLVNTDYIFNIDDDHVITDNKLLENLVAKSKSESDSVFYGWSARLDYEKEPCHIPADDEFKRLVNTGVSFFSSKLTNCIPLNPFKIMTDEEYRYADDHWVSLNIPLKRASTILENGVKQIDNFGHALSMEGKHIQVRTEIAKRFFK